MNQAEFHRAADLSEALDLLTRYAGQATILAGGTDVMVDVNRRTLKPKAIVYIGDIGLNGIEVRDGRLVIGAATPHADIACSPLVLDQAPLLAAACRSIGSAAIRNVGTIGGNLGTASPAGDACTALVALDAELVVMSADGSRNIPADAFFKGPGHTVLEPTELIREIIIPAPASGKRWGWEKIGQRRASVCSIISVAVSVDLSGSSCQGARIALGAAAPVPFLAREACGLLNGVLDQDVIAEAAHQASQEISPIDDLRGSAWYRREMAEALIKRIFNQLLDA